MSSDSSIIHTPQEVARALALGAIVQAMPLTEVTATLRVACDGGVRYTVLSDERSGTPTDIFCARPDESAILLWLARPVGHVPFAPEAPPGPPGPWHIEVYTPGAWEEALLPSARTLPPPAVLRGDANGYPGTLRPWAQENER